MENKLFENIFNESQDNNYGWFINSKNTADVLKVGDKFYFKQSFGKSSWQESTVEDLHTFNYCGKMFIKSIDCDAGNIDLSLYQIVNTDSSLSADIKIR